MSGKEVKKQVKDNIERRFFTSKRECITYVIIILWLYLGILASFHGYSLEGVSVYFLSLTGFVGSYILGESVRKSEKASLFKPKSGQKSKREILTYIIMALWAGIGTYTIISSSDIYGVSTYFGALTPFIGAYIIGDSYVAEHRLPQNGHQTQHQTPTFGGSDIPPPIE